MGGVERVSVNPQAGTDFVTVRDLSGTATDTVNLQLNTPDLRTDTVTVTGTQGNDAIKAATTANTHVVSGLPATVNVQNPERGQKLVIDARDGDDTVDADRHRPRHGSAGPQGRRGQGHDHRLPQRRRDRRRRRRRRRVDGRRPGHVHVGPGRGQRHRRGPGRDRLPADERLGRQRPLRRAADRLPHAGHARHRKRQPRPGRRRAASTSCPVRAATSCTSPTSAGPRPTASTSTSRSRAARSAATT